MHHLRKPGREVESSLANASFHELLETELVDRHPALGKPRDAFLVLVDARNTVPEVREACPRHQPNVAGSDDPYLEALVQMSSPDICALQDRCPSILTFSR